MDAERCGTVEAIGADGQVSDPAFVIGPDARTDLDRHVLWLREQAGPDVAARFAEAADESLVEFAATPGIGSPIRSQRPELHDLRKGRIAGFRDVLIFYLPQRDGIYVVRVLHVAQDWFAQLDID